ncbi:MAG: ATP-binding cassette domain-containing protein [Saccharospirillum sp.]
MLNQLDLTLDSGRVTALIGPNGCGKSTLLKAMARILTPASGGIRLSDGSALSALSARETAQRIALLPQSPLVPEGLKVFDLVAYGRSPHLNAFGHLRERDREAIQQALVRTDVESLSDLPLAQLSGGQRQRVWMAMILAQQADIILLDEPTTYLDLAHQYDLLDLVQDLAADGRTVITVLHDLNQACRYADELVVLKQGRLMDQGAPKKVMTEAMLREVFSLDAQILDDPETGTPLCVPRARGKYYHQASWAVA